MAALPKSSAAEITSNLENAAHYVREGQEYAKHLGKGNESHEG